MATMLERVVARSYVAHVDDERALGNSVIVTLKDDYEFVDDPGCGVQGFDTPTNAYHKTAKWCVRLMEKSK